MISWSQLLINGSAGLVSMFVLLEFLPPMAGVAAVVINVIGVLLSLKGE